MLAANARADATYNTTAGSGFNDTGDLTLTSSGGLSATLTFAPEVNTTAIPNNIDFGTFTLTCAACSPQAGDSGATFSPFSFDLAVTDGTATGTFTGTSLGDQTIYSDSSTIVIDWLPLQLGPGNSGATSGSFGNTLFTIFSPTDVLDPTSGATSVAGQVDADPIPEPSTLLSVIGGGLLLIGLIGRKKPSLAQDRPRKA